MVIMSERVYGNGKRQRSGGLQSVFSQTWGSACTFTGFWFVEHKCSLWYVYGSKKVFFFFCSRSNLSYADAERVMSVMNDAGGMSPVCVEVFISSY